IGLDAATQVVAAETRHHDVADDHVRPELSAQLEPLLAIVRQDHLHARALEGALHPRRLGLAVLDDQSSHWPSHFSITQPAICSSGNTTSAAPAAMAACGIPNTTEVRSSC